MATSSCLGDKTVEDICLYLEEQGFSESAINYVRDEELDGTAITIGLASDPGSSWLNDIIPKLGLRLKIHSALRSLFLQSQEGSPEIQESPNTGAVLQGSVNSDNQEEPYVYETPMSSEVSLSHTVEVESDEQPLDFPVTHKLCPSIPSRSSNHKSTRKSFTSAEDLHGSTSKDSPRSTAVSKTSSKPIFSKLSTHKKVTNSLIPQPFPIPTFRAVTEKNLALKKRTDSDRKYLVQTMATMLMTYDPKPSLSDCGQVAKALISKFTFLKDCEGDGEHSWKWFIYYRCNNVNRPIKDDNSPKAKKIKVDHTTHLYPVHEGEDNESFKRNLVLLKGEMQRPNRRSEVIKNLLCRTFANRWNDFTNNCHPESLAEYILEYPVLKKSNYAAVEFSLATKQDDVRDSFEEAFPLWAKAIVVYCKNSQQKNSMLKAETANYSDEIDDSRLSLIALRCLFLLFSALKTKKFSDNGSMPFVLNIVTRGTPPSEASQADNNQPHIVNFIDEDHVLHQYFVSVEHDLMMECNSLSSAIFFCVAAHYIFNLTYHTKTGDIWVFVQEKILQIPSKVKAKRSPSSISHFSGISEVYDTLVATADEASMDS